MEHHYNVEIAKKYGIAEAVLLQNIHFWLQKNKANNDKVRDGHYWTYNSTRAFSELFPEMTQSKIYACLKRLEERGVILTANYNKTPYDRTKWYALTELGWSLFGEEEFPEDDDETHEVNRNCKEEKPFVRDDFHLAKQKTSFCESKNEILRTQEPIPDSKTQIENTDASTDDETGNETERNARAREESTDIGQGIDAYAESVFDGLWDRIPVEDRMSLGQTYRVQRKNSLEPLARIILGSAKGVPDVPYGMFSKWIADAIALRKGRPKCLSYILKDEHEQIAGYCDRAYRLETEWR